MVVLGCLEPNPFQPDTDTDGASSSGGGSTGASTSATATTATTSPTSTSASTTEDPDTTMGASTDGPTETSVTTDDGTSTGEPTCAHSCVALPPGDWQGPAAVLHDAPDDPAPDCTGDFTEVSDPVFANLDAPAAMCSCDCDDPEGASCSQVTVTRYSDSGCDDAMPTDWTFGTSCYNTITGAMNLYWQATSTIDAGSCAPNPNFVVPEASWGDRITACSIGSLDPVGCDPGDACVATPAAPYDGRMCIWHDGDQQCPADIGYDVRTVYYGDFADDRDCEACECGDVEGSCDGSVYLFNPSSCSGTPIQTLSVGGSCLIAIQGVESADVTAAGLTPDASASCSPSDSQATGQAEGIDPVTFCCDS